MHLIQAVKDYAPLVSPILSPIIAAVTAILLYEHKERERVHLAIEWRYVDTIAGREERPFLVVHNRSDRSVAIRDMRFRTGALWRRRGDQTAFGYDDPEDIHFPYLVEPGKLIQLRLDEDQAVRLADGVSAGARLLSRLGRPRIQVEAVTTAGKRIRTSAEVAIPWARRPTWSQ